MKNTTLRKVNKSILFGLPAVVFLACASGSESGEDEESVEGSNDDTSQEAPAGKKGKPKKKNGVQTVGNWDILTKKPQFKEEYGTFGTVKLDVRNNSDEEDEPWLEIRLTNKAGDLVTSFDCIGDTVEPGQKTTLECISTDDYAPWAKWEVKNAI